MFNPDDIRFMERALRLARRGFGKTEPNPCVGAVVVKDKKIVGEGYHRRFGKDHAEVVALKKAGSASRGGTLYITLEPCCHFGKTPPCTDLIIQSGVRTVIAATRDPFLPRGKSTRLLHKAGVSLHFGLLEKKTRILNQIFFKNVLKKLPYVVGKVAMTLDGKIATARGDSRGISSQKSLRLTHLMRAFYGAILVGVETVLRDNPHLGVRFIRGRNAHARNPLRVILDSRLRAPLSSQVFRDNHVVIFASRKASQKKIDAFQKRGIRVFLSSSVTPNFVLKTLFQKGISSVLLEGGSHVLTSFWKAHMLDAYVAFIAPKLCGGERALSPLGGKGIAQVKNFERLKDVTVTRAGEDMVVCGYLFQY